MISSPDLVASRSRLADWLELRASFSRHGAGEADITSIWRLNSEERRDVDADETGAIVEPEIIEEGLEFLLARVAEEIAFRSRSLKDEYPFDVQKGRLNLALKPCSELTTSHWTYLFLLLMAGERDKALPDSEEMSKLIRAGRTLFHVCASIGVAGLIRNASAVWFGFPRPDGTGFLTALKTLCERLGHGQAKTEIPPGLPESPQDDGIDIVGWRSFGDRRGGNLIILCQAATGAGWDDKSVVLQLDAFRMWFAVQPYARATGAIALPFPAHHEVSECPPEAFDLAVENALHRTQSRHGVIIDRLRIVEAVRDVNVPPDGDQIIDGIGKLPELKTWVKSVMTAIRESA
jgi:hypothetical protein